MKALFLLLVVPLLLVQVAHAQTEATNYVVQIRPSDDNTGWDSAFSKFFPDGTNTTNFFDNKTGADDFNMACLSGDSMVVSASVSDSDINPPMITINVVLNGNTIHSNTAVGDFKPATVIWDCGK